MNPYYEDDWATIYHGDALSVLHELTWDVVITDPPYGTAHYATDTAAFDAAWLTFLVGSGPTAVFGWPERLVRLCVEADLVPDEWITWAPTNGACRGFNVSGLWRDTEHIAVFGSGLAWNSLRRRRSATAEAIAAQSRRGASARLDTIPGENSREGDVWTDAAPGLAFLSHLRRHPNEKPVSVLNRLVAAMVDDGCVVLDPFAGSGTTLRAAKDLGRRSIGIEIEEKFCEVAAKRLAQEVLDFGGAA